MFSRRKWGWYLVIWRWPGMKVKLLYFRTGKSISLQKHRHRHETWRMLFGRGMKECGYDISRLYRAPLGRSEGEGWYINSHIWHRFTAQTSTLVLEVQRGKCSEKDIERA